MLIGISRLGRPPKVACPAHALLRGLPVDHVTLPEEFVTGDAIAEMAAAVEAAGLDAVFVTDHPAPDDRWLAGGGHHAQDPMVALGVRGRGDPPGRCSTPTCSWPRTGTRSSPPRVSPRCRTCPAGGCSSGSPRAICRPEFAALGVEFDARNDRLVETVTLMRRAWAEDGVAVENERYTARGVTQLPHPPPVPIWIGGNSTAAMRRAVELGDGWSPFPNPPAAARAVKTPAITNLDELATRLDAARAYAAEIGRTAPLTVCFAPFASTDDHARFAELGIDWLAVQFDGCTTRAEWLDRLAAFARAPASDASAQAARHGSRSSSRKSGAAISARARASFPDGPAPQVRDAVLGDHEVELVARGRDDRSPRGARARSARCGTPSTTEVERRHTSERSSSDSPDGAMKSSWPPMPGVLPAADGVGHHLAVQVDARARR